MYTVTPFGVLLFEYHHHHHHGLYSPGWALASSSKCRQRPLSWASAHQIYNPVSLLLSLPRQSILISVERVLVDLQGLSTISF